jgi:hypothetical protein
VFLRGLPAVGRPVVIIYLGTRVRGTVRRVEDDGRRLLVSTEDGETLGFALNRATATFTAEGSQAGARLWFGSGSGSGSGPGSGSGSGSG